MAKCFGFVLIDMFSNSLFICLDYSFLNVAKRFVSMELSNHPGIEPMSPALGADSSPAEPSGEPHKRSYQCRKSSVRAAWTA